jgi:hypothetical protein
MKKFEELPRSEACRLIDFEKAEIHPGFVPRTFILVVYGTKPNLNIEVSLKPLVYIKQPEYWGIEVVGCIRGVKLPAAAPYTVTIPLDSLTGTKGIEVIGATGSKKMDVQSK